MSRGRSRGPDSRATVRMGQLDANLEAFNIRQSQAVARSLADYHTKFIGSPPTGPTIDERLYVLERVSVKWWIASLILWARDYYQAWRKPIKTDEELAAEEPRVVCGHPVEALAVRPDEPQIPCPKCGMMLLLPEEIADG